LPEEEDDGEPEWRNEVKHVLDGWFFKKAQY